MVAAAVAVVEVELGSSFAVPEPGSGLAMQPQEQSAAELL